MEYKSLEEKINDLLSDSNFLKLKSIQSKSNIFDIVGASHLEMWHSKFIKWLIDPNSDLGLKSYPLKRFLHLVISKGIVKDEKYFPKLTLADIENAKYLDEMDFNTEVSYKLNGESGRFDIIGNDKEKLKIVIENKIKANEGDKQTKKYAEYLDEIGGDFEHTLMIFLNADESKGPESEKFIHITYQDLNDFVIQKCINHPDITLENQFLLRQYSHNLRKPIYKNQRGKFFMALPDKELCMEIYKSHKDVLEEIYLSVKGKVPTGDSSNNKVRAFNTTLTDLVENKLLDKDDILYGDFRGDTYTATLLENDGNIKIKVDNNEFSSPSTAGAYIKSCCNAKTTNTNGWTFWTVKDINGRDKGTLADLREKINDLSVEASC